MKDMKELIYVGDPMCSWCYGFAPIKRKLEIQCKGRAATRLVVGGLHIDWTEPQDDTRKKFLREHWIEIGERSRQPFKFDILERNDFVYNTEPSCRAAVTARQMSGDQVGLNFFTALQSAFYAENQDITLEKVLIDLAGAFGLDKDKFSNLFRSENMKQETVNDFEFSKRLGVTGFPTVVVKDSLGYRYLTVGYQAFEHLEPTVEAWLTDQLGKLKNSE